MPSTKKKLKPHRAWRKQRRRVADDGMTCIYEPLRPSIYYVRGRRSSIPKRATKAAGS